MITVVDVPNQYVSLMNSDGWQVFGSRGATFTTMFKRGQHTVINGLSHAMYRKITRNMITKYRFEVVK